MWQNEIKLALKKKAYHNIQLVLRKNHIFTRIAMKYALWVYDRAQSSNFSQRHISGSYQRCNVVLSMPFLKPVGSCYIQDTLM